MVVPPICFQNNLNKITTGDTGKQMKISEFRDKNLEQNLTANNNPENLQDQFAMIAIKLTVPLKSLIIIAAIVL